MNYYEHHIGDYAEATSHLSWIEDAAYTRLIRKYYSREKPLPADIKACQRLVGARSKEELAAVEAVLNEFFELKEDGWHQDRCDEEIARYQSGEPERQIKKQNEDARVKKHREERQRLFQALHAAGQHPAWNIPITQLRDLHERFCLPPATEAVTGPETLQVPLPATPATASHTQYPYPNTHIPVPIPISQSPDTTTQTPGNKTEALDPSVHPESSAVLDPGDQTRRAATDDKPRDLEQRIAEMQRREAEEDAKPNEPGPNVTPEGKLAIALRDAGVSVRSTDPVLANWLRDGFTHEHIVECVGIARIRKQHPEVISANYLDRIVRDKPKPPPSHERRPGSSDRDELEVLKARREKMGIAGFRDPNPGERAADYRKAQDAEWYRRQDVRALSERASQSLKTVGKS